ncbi:serine/threonine-protein kinase [Bailinhaonella thermotolerans]|nr:serine/threonine-protein kinase [Bailinhaonella thermotolerans]
MGSWAVSGYDEVRELAAGGGGRVVLAVHRGTGVPVVVRYLGGARRGEEFLARFRDEARLLAGLDVPEVVRVYEYAEALAGAALVTEAVDGAPLRRLLAGGEAAGPEAALVVWERVLRGLAAAHALGVPHRDCRPGNVLVRADGEVKLADTGLAVPDARIGVAGAPPYLAPERWAAGVGSAADLYGDAAAGLYAGSAAADVYAATAVFHACLTGVPPYRAGSLAELRRLHESAPVPLAAVPAPLRPLVEAGLAKDPAERPSAADLAGRVEAAAAAAYGERWRARGRGDLSELLRRAVPGRDLPLSGLPLGDVPVRGVPPLVPAAPAPGGCAAEPGEAGTGRRDGGLGDGDRGDGGRAAARVRDALVTVAGMAMAGAVGVAGVHLARSGWGSGGVSVAVTSTVQGRVPAAAPAGTPGAPVIGDAAPSPPPGPRAAPPAPEDPAPSAPSAPSGSGGPGGAGGSGGPGGTGGGAVRAARVGFGEMRMDGATGKVAVTVTAPGREALPLAVTFTAGAEGTAVRTVTTALSGGTEYVRVFSHAYPGDVCGRPWGVRVVAGGVAREARAVAPPCPEPEVTKVAIAGMRLGPGTSARARVLVETSGPGPVPLSVVFTLGKRAATVHTTSVRLTGSTAYRRTFEATLPRRPCGGYWGVRVTAGDRTASARRPAARCPRDGNG